MDDRPIYTTRSARMRALRKLSGMTVGDWARLLYGVGGTSPQRIRHMREMEQGTRPIPPQTLRLAQLTEHYRLVRGANPTFDDNDELVR